MIEPKDKYPCKKCGGWGYEDKNKEWKWIIICICNPQVKRDIRTWDL